MLSRLDKLRQANRLCSEACSIISLPQNKGLYSIRCSENIFRRSMCLWKVILFFSFQTKQFNKNHLGFAAMSRYSFSVAQQWPLNPSSCICYAFISHFRNIFPLQTLEMLLLTLKRRKLYMYITRQIRQHRVLKKDVSGCLCEIYSITYLLTGKQKGPLG